MRLILAVGQQVPVRLARSRPISFHVTMIQFWRRVLAATWVLLAASLVIVALPGQASAAGSVDRVGFFSKGLEMSGVHYSAAGDGPRPVLVMALGFGCTQDAILPEVAPRFTEAGFDVFTFDYRYFGASAGVPRNFIDIPSQLEDWRAAVDAAKNLPGVDRDRVGMWGTSFAGGHVLQIGSENIPGVRAVIAQAPHVNGIATVATIPVPILAQLTALGTADAAGSLIGQPPIYLPTAGEPGTVAMLPQPGALDGYKRVVGADFDNRTTARTALEVPFYSPDLVAALSKSPTFIATGDTDNIVSSPAARALADRMGAEGRGYPGGHFDVYPGGVAYPQLILDQIAFLQNHL
ncbi:MAG: alpha/beta hydrolase [Rhodococcus sp. (in: high G+C Gram-positive bacteria)]